MRYIPLLVSTLSLIEAFPYTPLIVDLVVIILVSLIIYLLLAHLTERIGKIKTRYSLRKLIGLVTTLVDFVVIISIFVKNTSIVLVSAGLFSAGIAFSLRDPITSLIAWLVILFLRPFGIGDRIKIIEEEGDVVDINAFFITIMEINQWTSGDIYTGRLVERL